MNKERVIATLFEALDELNPQLPEEHRLEKSLDTPLIGKATKLDSLGLLMMINTTEARLQKLYGTEVELPFEKTVQRNSPFRTIGTLVDYILEEAEGKSD